jgi:mannose-6-phosphate isomerase-like protein (cupin superfamily)
MAIAIDAAVVRGDEFETVHYPADEIRLRVAEGEIHVTEYISTDRDGPPAHSHEWTEVEYVIEGEVEFYQNGKWTRGGPGTVQMLPAGVAHSVRIPSGTARLLMITIGAPFAPMARELSAHFAQPSADMAGAVAIAKRFGLRLEQ